MKSCRSRRVLALAGITALTVSPVASVHAQGEERILEEIVVTAAYREQGLQDVPVSVSAVAGETITATAIQKAEDIQFLVPNFTLTETGIGTNAFIRGIGSGINQAFEQSVGTYVDGVHFGRAQQWRAPFLDVERVEVLRGPQSILFGKNSVAGAVSITTARPTDEFEASLMASNEFEHNELILEGMISGPITERFRYRVAARTRDLDGHMVNATFDTDEPTREDWTVRAKLEFDITDNLLATLKAEAGEFEVTGRHIEIVNEVPGPNGLTYAQTLVLGLGGHPSTLNNVQDEIRSSNGDFSNNELENYVLTLDWNNGSYNFESITAWSSFEYDEFCDCDFTGTEVFGAALQETYDQFSQEFRLASPTGGSFDYIAGIYYQTSDHDFADQIIVTPTSVLVAGLAAGPLISGTQASRLATVENDVISAFAQFNFHFSDAVTLQLGGRVTKDERDGSRTLSITDLDFQPLPAPPALQSGAPMVYAGGFGITSTNLAGLAQAGVPGAAPLLATLGTLPVEGNRDTSKFSPEVKFIWNVDDNALFYASWSRGFKSGSFDFRANNKNFYPDMETSFEFDDEEATNVELGAKLTLADGAAEFNLAVFKTDYENLQISIFDGILGFNVGNAASADILGLEADLRWAATDNLTISGGIAITDFEFTDFKNGQCYFGRPPDVDIDGDGVPELCDYTGNTNQMVSDLQGNVTFDWRVPIGSSLEFGALLDLFYTDEYHASATFDPKLIQDAYTMLNLRLALGAQSGRWQVAVLGRNITDEIILSFGGDTPLAGSNFFSQSNYAFFGAGRTVSLQGQVRF
jgi:outer membrane receptor protein involved in Fe transport